MMTTPGNTGAAVITIANARTTTIGMTGKMPGTGDGRRADISSIETSTGSIAGISPNTGDGGIVIPRTTTGTGITDRGALGKNE